MANEEEGERKIGLRASKRNPWICRREGIKDLMKKSRINKRDESSFALFFLAAILGEQSDTGWADGRRK